jgi:hypothetical protein
MERQIMKTLPKAIGTLILVLAGTLASGAAMAQHHGHGGYGYGGGVRFGISLGVPLYGPGYYPAPYYAYPAPVYAYPAPAYAYPAPAYSYPAPAYGYPAPTMGSASPPAYVERSVIQVPAQVQADWFYCAASKSYYPYVNECPSGWQRVPAQPPTR